MPETNLVVDQLTDFGFENLTRQVGRYGFKSQLGQLFFSFFFATIFFMFFEKSHKFLKKYHMYFEKFT